MAHLVILRHGTTEINEWNERHPMDKRIGGQLESPLTEQGKADATEAGKKIARMAGIDIQLAISSDLERARRTRDLILQQIPKKGIPVIAIPELREINYGEFAGRKEAAIRQKYPEFFDDPNCNQWRGSFHQKAPDGENYTDIGKRLKRGLDPLLDGQTGDSLIVSHRHALRVLLYQLLDLTPEQTYGLDIPNTEPIVIARGNPNRVVGEGTLEKLLLHRK